MTIPESVHTKEVIANDVRLLREYATRSVLQGCALMPEEQHAHVQVLAELREKAGEFGVTEKEVIQLVLKGLDNRDEPCCCVACQQVPNSPQDSIAPSLDTFDPEGLNQ